MVAAGTHPWIDDWNKLITDSEAQRTYTAGVNADMGANRQRADADAHAAYLNALRWYISGDTTYADAAVNICNAWSTAVNQVPSNTGLVGIPIFDFAMAGEVLRLYSGWSAPDFARFKTMMTTYLYPSCHDFLTNHNGAAIDAYWANWDACNLGAMIAMGVLCDDADKFNEGVNYFKSGAGNGCIMNAVYYLHTPTFGQWQESGRDQEHAQLGIGLLGAACQVAWNQGVDLFGFDNNRLLAGAEYVAQTNLSQAVPYLYYTNSDAANQDWVSINGMGRLDDRPVWELIYNHYAVLEGLSAPNSQAMAQLMRPEHGSADHFGYGTLAFTLNSPASPYPPLGLPPSPTGLLALAGSSQVELRWNPSPNNSAQGYSVLRSTTNGGPYTSIASWTASTYPRYTDTTAGNGTTYYYVVAAINQSGTSVNSSQASATPVTPGSLPSGWTNQDVGTVGASGHATYANAKNGLFLVSGTGGGLGGTSDTGYNYTCTSVTGDYILTARLWSVSWNSGGGEVGLMMRETLSANSREVQMTLGGTGLREGKAGLRTTTGGNLNHYGGNDYTVTPSWFRLQRAGNTFTAYESSDGLTWYAVKSATISMASSYYVGLVMDNGSTTLNSATFDHVTSSIPAAPTGLSGTVGTGQVSLGWTASPDAASYTIQRSTASGGSYVTIATGVTGTTYTDTTAVAGTTYYYVVTAVNATGQASVYSPEAAVIATTVTLTGFTPYTGSIGLAQSGVLGVDNSSGTYAASVIRSSGLTINGGPGFSTGSTSFEPANLLDNGSASGNTNDFFGPLVLSSGPLFMKLTPNASGNLMLTFDSLARSPGTQLNIGHPGNFGGGVGTSTISSAAAGAANVVITTAPAPLMTGSGATGTTSAPILPFAFVNNSLATYDTSYGLRALNASTEMATLASGMTAGQNAKITTGSVTLGTDTTINALYGSGGTITGSSTLNVTSGAIVCNVGFNISNTTLAFGTAEGQINVANSRTLTINSAITGSGGLTIGLENYNGSTASLILGGTNSFTGITTVSGNDPNLKVKLTSGLALQNSTLDYNNYGASLQFGSGIINVTSATLGGLKGGQNLALTNSGNSGGGVALSVGGDGDSTTYSGVISGAGSLAKTGPGALTLTATNTYTGATTVTAGRLLVTGSLAAGSAVSVSGGVLGGTGTINGSTTLATGGTISPGLDGAGTLTMAGALVLNGGGSLAFDLASPATSDKLVLTGSYTPPASGVVALNLTALTGFGAGTYPLITGAGGISASSFIIGSTPGGYTYTLSAVGGTLSLVVSAPPAPAGLTATAGNSQVALAWTAASGATSYNVKRATSSGGTYATLATGVATTGYTDSGLTNDTTYYYAVSAVNTAGESPNSTTISATPLTAYELWKAAYGLSALASTAAPDGDGLSILLKFATGLIPGTRDSSPVTITQVGDSLTIQFPRLSPAPVNYTVEASGDLSTWTVIATLPSGSDTWSGSATVSETGSGSSRTTTVTDPVKTSSTSRRFLHLKVSF